MTNDLYIDSGYISLIKAGEQLCGDRVVFASGDDTAICVVADGLGSGVKANILATLTSQILATMSAGGMSVEDCVNTIVRTLPECSVRKIAYSTFTIVKIRDQRHVELTRFDNPHTIVLRGGKNYDFTYVPRMIEGKKIYESKFDAEENDVLVVMSDGAIYAGIGEEYAFGWGRDNIIRFLEARYSPDMTAKQLARTLYVYLFSRATIRPSRWLRLCRRRAANLMIGPPSSKGLDDLMLGEFFFAGGREDRLRRHDEPDRRPLSGQRADRVARLCRKRPAADLQPARRRSGDGGPWSRSRACSNTRRNTSPARG